MGDAVLLHPPGRPSQIKLIRPAQMELFAKIVCYPPLNQLTVIGRDQQQVVFSVVVQASDALPGFPENGWEVSVSHDCPTGSSEDSNTWKDLPLSISTGQPLDLVSASSATSSCYRFSGALELGRSVKGGTLAHFTIKYRSHFSRAWQSVKHQFGLSDGTLLLAGGSKGELTASWAPSIFGDLHLQEWNIFPLQSQTPGASLFKVESKKLIPRKSDIDAKYESLIFGSSHVGFLRYMTLVRLWTPWLAPRHGEQKFHITEDALFCSFLTQAGQHAVLLPINGVNDTVTVFRSDEEGHIIVAARNDGAAEGKFEFLAALADDFEVANAAVMYEARSIILKTRSTKEQAAIASADSKIGSAEFATTISSADAPGTIQSKPQPEWLEIWYDGLTYCTWNGLGQDLTTDKLFVALDDLATHGIHVSGLIIDDNWQSLDGVQDGTSQFERGWTDFEANNEGFPGGLKSAVTQIKARHPAISNIAVWHAMLGYWGGISPSGSIAKKYKTIEVKKQGVLGSDRMLAVDPSDAHRLYDDFYAFLSSCGITSVKTDVQFHLDELTATPDRRAFATAYQSAWTTAHLRHLSGKAISCMSQIPQILFHSFLPVNSPRILLRTSDDFFPTIPLSHPWHVFCNAYNALFVQHLNVLPDWDMFQTSHQYSGFHAAARCLSGGPIYITDTPGEHNFDLITQMTAENVRGQTVILRPSVVGKAMSPYDQYHKGHMLKIGTYNGASQTGYGILGLFNISDHEISALVPITEFPGVDAAASTPNTQEQNELHPSGRFIIRSHVTGQISRTIAPANPAPASNLVFATLPIRGYDILTANPVYDFSLSSPTSHQSTAPTTSISILGLVGKMTGACAVISTTLEVVGTTNQKLGIHVSLKALGTLGIWTSDLGGRSIDDGFLITILGQVVPRGRVQKRVLWPDQESNGGGPTAGGAGVLEVDLLGAWKDMKLDSGWSNEVRVSVFMHGRGGETNGYTGGGMNGYTRGEMNGYTGRELNGFMGGEMNGFTGGKMNGYSGGETNGSTEGGMNGYSGGETNGSTGGGMNGSTGGGMNGSTGGGMNGSTGGGTNGCMEEK